METLVNQSKVFEELNTRLKKVMDHQSTTGFTLVADFCKSDLFGNMVHELLVDIEFLDKSLNNYLD
jgi:hypothetical protein